MNHESQSDQDQVYREAARVLAASDEYRVLRRLRVPDSYAAGTPNDTVLRGLFVDVETTSLDVSTCEVIELGMVPFEYTPDGRVLRVLHREAISAFNDPARPIPTEIVSLTGITDDMVRGQRIDTEAVVSLVAGVDLVLAHNAAFDRPIAERSWPVFASKPWACTMADVDWAKHGVRSGKLDYLATQFGVFFDGHRAIEDCLAGIHLLAQNLPGQDVTVLAEVLASAARVSYRVEAIDAPFERKDILKQEGYRWNPGGNGRAKAWWKEVPAEDLAAEKRWLAEDIYEYRIDVPAVPITAKERYAKRG